MMKRLLITWLIAIMSFTAIAQQSNTISFMGIPVDGSKAKMVKRLKTEKGFFYESKDWKKDGFLTGNFNGYQVNVGIREYNGLVNRVSVFYPDMSKTQVKRVYNDLYRQLSKEEKYIFDFFNSSGELDEDEDISYEISVNSKQYQNVFFYPPWGTLNDFEMRVKNNLSLNEELLSLYNSTFKDGETDRVSAYDWGKEHSEGNVWFTISTGVKSGDYHITIYYDNTKNQANGEDL